MLSTRSGVALRRRRVTTTDSNDITMPLEYRARAASIGLFGVDGVSSIQQLPRAELQTGPFRFWKPLLPWGFQNITAHRSEDRFTNLRAAASNETSNLFTIVGTHRADGLVEFMTGRTRSDGIKIADAMSLHSISTLLPWGSCSGVNRRWMLGSPIEEERSRCAISCATENRCRTRGWFSLRNIV